ncbi:MAG: hypothetical protein ACXV3F_14085, partial [Frankiaceae bacterium]
PAVAAGTTPETLGNMRLAVEMNMLDTWEARSRELRLGYDVLGNFARFADIEDEFGPIERRVLDMELSVDESIQLAIDAARGK